MAQIHIGTMGFSYKDWVGAFYPAELPARSYLSYYSRVFNAAEIDSSFYGTPRLDTLVRWHESTPPDFKFCLKTPRQITHELGLVGAEGLMLEFLGVVRGLGAKLGVILLQFPPSFTAAQLPVLDSFLSAVRKESGRQVQLALEIRDRSWYLKQELLEEVLRRHNVAWAATEYPGLPARISITSDFLYIRWIGRHGSYSHHDHERVDLTDELQAWWARMQAPLAQVGEVYGFFNNDYAGFAVGTARRFKEIAGLPDEPGQPPQQGRLF